MKQRIFSGIQPSGDLHIGNYLGAIKQWVGLQDEYESIFCVVDMHAITVPQDPAMLRKKSLQIAKIYLASGIDPAKSSLFIQSHVPEHAELAWLLNTIAKNGDLTKMTQFKGKTGFDEDIFIRAMREKANDKIEDVYSLGLNSGKYGEKELSEGFNAIFKIAIDTTIDIYQEYVKEPFNTSTVGLFDYPVLMAADILLYDTQVVPVGDDQVQHIELTRTLARRFNDRFGETFRIPEARIMKEGARIMALDDPTKKMSKSAISLYNAIALSDDAETVRKKIKKAVTDSGSEIVYQDDKPALKNLINIYTLLSGISISDIEKKYEGKGYGDFKADLAEVVVDFLTPFQEKVAALSDEETLRILREGADRVRSIAAAKLAEAKKRIGFLA
jgi:tryptophanyl-tRNA synthetase